MKRILLPLVGFIFLLGLKVGNSQTEDLSKEIHEKKFVQPATDNFLRTQMDDIERRVSVVEEEIHSLEEKTKNLDRRVDDLRQRH